MRSRAATAAVGVIASLVVSVLVWWYFGTLLLFLLIPFVPFLLRGQHDRRVRECPRCQFETTNPEDGFCPRDGERLRERRDDTDGRW
ncbi:MAG: hypothetical protein V5A55_07670 [Halovenus sp.]